MTEHVIVNDADGIRTIRMNRPDKKNALTLAMYETMTAALEGANADDSVRCLLIAGVSGVAVGVGTTMLFHCDFVVAGSDARFSTPFVSLGLIPEAASSLLAPLLMGHRRAFEFLV